MSADEDVCSQSPPLTVEQPNQGLSVPERVVDRMMIVLGSAKIARKAVAKRVAAKADKSRKTAPQSQSRKVATPTLLAGGNPQIAKAYGDAPRADLGECTRARREA
jgi:hypothetical protein